VSGQKAIARVVCGSIPYDLARVFEGREGEGKGRDQVPAIDKLVCMRGSGCSATVTHFFHGLLRRKEKKKRKKREERTRIDHNSISDNGLQGLAAPLGM